MRVGMNRFVEGRRDRIAVSQRCGLEPLEARQLFATFFVDSTDNTFDPNDGNTTLQDAIFKANTTPGADTIELQPRVTYFVDRVHNTNWGPSGLPTITSQITIEGNGSTIMRSFANGTPAFRFWYIPDEVHAS